MMCWHWILVGIEWRRVEVRIDVAFEWINIGLIGRGYHVRIRFGNFGEGRGRVLGVEVGVATRALVKVVGVVAHIACAQKASATR